MTCIGRCPLRPCVYGLRGERPAYVVGTDLCTWCDLDAMATSLVNARERGKLRTRFKSFPSEVQATALQYVPQEYREWFRTATRVKRCPGIPGQACVFALTKEHQRRAEVKGRHGKCAICDSTRLGNLCRTSEGRRQLAGMLNRMHPDSKALAIAEHVPPRYRDEIAHSAPFVPDTKNATWDSVLLSRRSRQAEFTEEEKQSYQETLAKEHKQCHFAISRQKRNVEVSAALTPELPLPAATRSQTSARLQHWMKFGSWAMCAQCGAAHPRPMTPETFDKEPPPTIKASECCYCNAKQRLIVPTPDDVPMALRGLSKEAAQALSPLEIDTGPVVRARDYGRDTGYRQHTAMFRFAWQATSVEDRIGEIED